MYSRILNAARKLDRSEANLLREIGNYLARKGEYAAAANYFHQINDTKSIVYVHNSIQPYNIIGPLAPGGIPYVTV